MKKGKIKLNKKYSPMGQYGWSNEDDSCVGEFEIMENQYDKYSKSIGMFIISFSNMEDCVERDFAKSIHDDADEPGYRIIKYLSFRDKVNLLKDDYLAFIKYSLPESKQEKILSELNIIYSKLVELSEFRNRVAHANWYSLDKNGFVRCKITENKENVGIVFEKVKMTPGVLIKFTRQNYAISHKLDEFREKIWEAINRYEYKEHLKREKSIKK